MSCWPRIHQTAHPAAESEGSKGWGLHFMTVEMMMMGSVMCKHKHMCEAATTDVVWHVPVVHQSHIHAQIDR